MTPIIEKDEAGNKLTKSNTISFRGIQRNHLAQFGSNFWGGELTEAGYIELEGDGIPVYTEVKKAVEAYISKEIYSATKTRTREQSTGSSTDG